ncbi:MAG: amidohydrolase [Proteobacteria bacterium]|nr:amidohydrolase [Pseudomonadota bacterium]
MIIDFHTHIFPEEVRKDRQSYFSGEPSFEVLYKSPNSRLIGADETVASMNEQGVDVSVVFGFPWKNEGTVKRQNDAVVEAVARYPDRLVGFCCLDPFMKNPAGEIERCLEGGLSGVGELAFYESGLDKASIDALQPVMEICREKNLPVLIHTNEPVGHVYPGKTPNTLAQIYDLVKRYPENKIVLAHWGGGLFLYSVLKKEVKERLKNVYFDTAASPFLYEPEIYHLAKYLAGLDKILFGSDFPLIKPETYFKELETTALSKKDIQSICGDNAAELLGILT